MRSFRKWAWVIACVFLAGTGVLLRALVRSPEDATAGSAIEGALFRLMDLPGGAVLARRPPLEAVQEISKLVNREPARSELYALRAQEEERRLEIEAAEEDWKKAAERSPGQASPFIDLADFYHRRLQPLNEIQALTSAGKLPDVGGDAFLPEVSQRSWHAFERALEVAKEARAPAVDRERIYDAWLARYPKSPAAYVLVLDALVAGKDTAQVRKLSDKIALEFPDNTQLQVESEAKLAGMTGGAAAKLDAYARRFTPLWPAEIRTQYYRLLRDAHRLRKFLRDARAAVSNQPGSIEPVLRLFFYYEQESNRELAKEELLAWESRRSAANSPASMKELEMLAALFQRAGDYDDSARASYAIYQAGSSTQVEKESALAALIALLLDVPEQPLRLGRRDLSLYRNIGQMDRHPGFLNGILSLALNTTFPQYEYQTASQSAATYFHRAAASSFLETFKHEFPQAKDRAALEAKLFGAFAAYGQDEALIRLAPAWLRANAGKPEYVDTALLLADAYSGTKRTSDEFALYDNLLLTLAAKNEHVPLGPTGEGASPAVRSIDYARVLDRYVSRLTQARRVSDAIALYAKEIDRNPDDPGLYRRLSLFVEQNRLDGQLAETYRAAFDRFKDASWADKLARLYLRKKQSSAYLNLAHRVTDAFEGSELADFVTAVSPDPRMTPVLYRQINLYAHRRFPHNLTFVRNLLVAYQNSATADPAAYEKLLRNNWFYDAALRIAFFEYLSRTGRLRTELAGLPPLERAVKEANLAAVQMRAEGLAWLTDFDAGADAFVALAQFAPGDRTANRRAVSIERSLSGRVPNAFEQAITLAGQDIAAAPRDASAVIVAGEIYADRELYGKAEPLWNRVAAIDPGSAEGFGEAAAVFWDYFRYGDALRLISEARNSFGQPARFAYEAGAIYENEGKFAQAADEYAQAALEEPPTGANALAQARLLTLGRRKSTAATVDERTAALITKGFGGPAMRLRVALLENQGRRGDIQSLLNTEIPRAVSASEIEEIKTVADRFGFNDTAVACLTRLVELTSDPIEKLKARVEVALFREDHNELTRAGRELGALLDENPNLLGVIRANVDFDWRQKQYGEAVSTLAAAASRARDPFQKQLRLEAAQKASEAGEYQQARELLDQLLVADPYNQDLLAQKAATYARADDPDGLLHYYTSELEVLQSSALPAAEKADRVAGLRRGYILALISAKRYSEALEQYQQVLNRFAEDEGLAREAARFAEKHQLGRRLTSYYERAALDSPRDYRWPLLVARLETSLGEFASALTNYGKAATIRPDRVDILQAKENLEMRLLRFGDAIRTTQNLYELSYHDRRYLADEAELNVRLGKAPEAVRLLRAAYVGDSPSQPAGYVSVMRQLVAWRMFSQADTLYRELRPMMNGGSDRAGEAVTLEAQSLVSLHRPGDAVRAVAEAWNNLPAFKTSGTASPYGGAIGSAAKEYLTPAEKAAFSLELPLQGFAAPMDTYELANAAGLFDAAADALIRNLRARSGNQWNVLQQLQSSRLAFRPLARELESLASKDTDSSGRVRLLSSAIEAYRKAGSPADALRIASAFGGPAELLGADEYATLFLQSNNDRPGRVGLLARHNPAYANAVVQHVVATGRPPEAGSLIKARGATLAAPWTKSYLVLAGLYFLSPEPTVTQSFEEILGPRTVGGELANLSQKTSVLRGNTWLYYAARYGDYLLYLKRPSADDLPTATLESAPAASNSYVSLGDLYADLKQSTRAIELYQAALQLSPDRADVYDRMALVSAQTGRMNQAREDWRKSLQILAARVEEGPLGPDYWQTASEVFLHLNRAHLIDELHPSADAMLRAYFKRNGSFNALQLLQSILVESPDENRAVGWIVQLAREDNLDGPIGDLLNSQSLQAAQKDPLYRFLIEHARTELARSAGSAGTAAAEQLREALVSYARYLLNEKNPQQARQVLAGIEPADRRPGDLVLETAALTGHLDEQLDAYRSNTIVAPPGEQVLSVAAALEKENADLAQRLREFEYERELDGGESPASAYFGLAKIRFAQGRPADARTLIEQVIVNVGAPFEYFEEAIRMLEGAGRNAEAAEYAARWKTSEPWNAKARFTFARLKNDGELLNLIRESAEAPYAVRAAAAKTMRSLDRPAAGADELALLTHRTVTASEASPPFFISARLLAAQTTAKGIERLKLLAQAIAYDPGLSAPRLDLAEIALDLNQTAFGLAALDSYVSSPPLDSARNKQLAQVQSMAAKILVDRGDFAGALALFDQSLASQSNDGERARVQTLRDAADARMRLAALNAARQPVITDRLTQPAIVKPKLTTLPADGVDR